MDKKFTVAMVVKTRDELPSWVVERLEANPSLEMRYGKCKTQDELVALAGDADMIWTMAVTPCLTADVLPKLTRCKAIFRSGSGMDGYPVDEATARGIYMCNCPESISESVAEHAVALLISFLRQIPFMDAETKAQTPGFTSTRRYHWHISGRTLGLVGFGRIARRVVELLAGFHLKVLCYDPFADQAKMRAAGVTPASLDEVLSQADYISLHCPLTKETWHLIGARELKLMKPNAVLVNTSRGNVVDEAALIDALQTHSIGGAALDVTAKEPVPADSPLLKLDNVIVTPHIAAFSADFEKNFYECSIKVIEDCSKGDFKAHSMNLR
ncbi:MAG: phosphoglycerate dehydrogenase [Victivallales bacterium]|nr:phosphoglycerate dehydrogenase [Victivallales bacterium]